jgi:uncharacterized membrane protein YgcG
LGEGCEQRVVLFVFIQDRKMYVQVGYGLKVLPVLCANRLEDQIKPRFKAGNYTAGLTASVQS